MQKYANYHGDSGVVEFNITNNAISINFKHGKKTYVYSNSVTGKPHVDTMKALAVSGRGLSTYVAKNKTILKFT